MNERRVMLLTGAGGNLGSAICDRCVGDYDIAAVYRNSRPLVASQELAFVDPVEPQANLLANARPVFAIQADLGAAGQIERTVELVLARYQRVDVLVNAAGEYRAADLIDPDSVASGLAQLVPNMMVPLRLAALLAREFWKDRDRENVELNRNIVNVSSMSGVNVYPGSGQGIYAASKAALNYATYHMAAEFRPLGMRVNGLAPDNFPSAIPTESVVDAIVDLDQGLVHGQVMLLDEAGRRFLYGNDYV